MDLQTRIQTYFGSSPRIAKSAFVAESATILGAVDIGDEASVWFGAVLRGDINRISIGRGSNVQDGCILHVADDYPCIIGEDVTLGHAAILHACTVENEVLIGMRATVLDGAVIGKRSIVGAHALVTGKTIIPPGSLVLGSPAKVVKTLTEEEQDDIKYWATKYVALSRRYLSSPPPSV
ncbi:MAG TPA: gamma carbonic anhydrase family protein [Chthoniobacterales bacterium]